MGILNVFQKNKPEEEKPKRAKLAKREVKKREEVKEVAEKINAPVEKKAKRKVAGNSYKILKNPHITEKATDLLEKNLYAFKVFPRANKTEIKKAIEDDFGVNVVSVKIINVSKKKRRVGKTQGVRPGYKKAIVRIGKDQKIEVLPR